MEGKQDIEQLLFRRLNGLATDVENHRIEAWAREATENQEILERLENEHLLRQDLRELFELVDSDEGRARLARMDEHIRQSMKTTPIRTIQYWIPYAAATALLLTFIGVMWNINNRDASDTGHHIAYIEEIQPGGNRAVLTLANGRTITLDESQNGIVMGEDNIAYNDGSTLLEQTYDNPDRIPYALLVTPKGGTYQVQLPDGTKVWLNAASTLKYPMKFVGEERVVELEGEAYFEVQNIKYDSQNSKLGSTGRSIPFKVVSKGQTVEVLGTAFNVAAYPDQYLLQTTLVEGSVSVLSSEKTPGAYSTPFAILKPGEQALVRGSHIETKQVDVSQYTAWMEGYFYFNGHSPQDAFAQLGRWYDIDVIYLKNVPTIQFFGRIDRSKSLSSLLKILEKAGLEFEIVPIGGKVRLLIGSD